MNGLFLQADKQLKKQAKRDRVERQQSELQRLKDVLKLQNLLKSVLGSDNNREEEGLHAGKHSHLVTHSLF